MAAPRLNSPLVLIGACIGGGFLAVFTCLMVFRSSDEPQDQGEPQAVVHAPTVLDAAPAAPLTETASPPGDDGSVAVPVIASGSPFATNPTMGQGQGSAPLTMPRDASVATDAPVPPTAPAPASAPESEPAAPEPVVAAPESDPLAQELANLPAPEKRPTDRVSEEPELELPSVPSEILPIKPDRFGEIKKNISLERRAKHALALFEVFSKSFQFDANQQAQIDKDLVTWKERADQDLYRLGTKWVSQNAVADAVEKAQSVLAKADRALADRQFRQAVELYEEAARADPNNIRADYTLGLMYSLPFAGDFQVDKSLSHFTRVDTKSPNFAAAHNSLGITYAKQGKFTNSVSHFEKAADLQMYCPEVVQNLGRLRHLAELLHVDARSLVRCQELYDRLIADGKGKPFQPDVGWLHMMPVFSETERTVDLNELAGSSPRDDSPASLNDLTPANFVTAVLISPEYLLTTKSGVTAEGSGLADRVAVRDQYGQDRFGVVVGVADHADLALIHVSGLRGLPLRLEPTILPSGTPLTAHVATPTGQLTSGRPKISYAISGGVVASPGDPMTGSRSYALNHAVGPNAMGAPAMDANGSIAAILTRPANQFQTFSGGALQGITAVDAIVFLERHLGKLPAFTRPGPSGFAAGSPQMLTHSVFPLTTYYRSSMRSLVQAADSGGEDRPYYEDDTCPVCHGAAVLSCSSRGCVAGSVKEEYFVFRQVGSTNIQGREKRFRQVDCLNCDGGKVDCPRCSDGRDGSLSEGRGSVNSPFGN